jgi:hypothetical protein
MWYMTETQSEQSFPELIAELTRALEELESEIEPQRRLRPPTPEELTRFTSEIAIPGVILVLKTNIQALRLLQRTLRFADGRNSRESNTAGIQDRAVTVGRATLSKLEGALEDLESTLQERPVDEDARDLLQEARELQQRTAEELADMDPNDGDGDTVDIDVESELQSIKNDVDDTGGNHGGTGIDGRKDDEHRDS